VGADSSEVFKNKEEVIHSDDLDIVKYYEKDALDIGGAQG